MKLNKGTLFVVEDDPKSRKAVEALASSLRIPCETFTSAEEFLKRYDPSLRGCALLDFRLRGMDGLELQERLRAAGSALEVVLVSAYADVSTAVRAMKNGALYVLEKPYTSDMLAEVILESLNRANRAENPPDRKSDDQRVETLLCDLHDGIAQYLAMAVMLLDNCRKLGDDRKKERDSIFDHSLQLLRRSLDELRALFLDKWQEASMQSISHALEETAAEFQDRLDIELVHDLKTVQTEKQVLQELSRMVHESLTNAWQHSRSRKVRIEANQTDGHLCVDIRDWGIGYDPENVGPDRFGLLGIGKRARQLGGNVAVTSAPGKGTCVSVRIPLAPQESHNSKEVSP